MITVVTSFTEDHYREYAKDFVDTFNQFWDKSIKLVVYYEGTNLREGWHPYSEIEGLEAWLDAIANFDLMSGSLGGDYNINFDARMVRKAFIEAHACKQFKGKVFWVDADVITFDRVTPEFLHSLLPDDKLNCFIGRENNKLLDYTESGFIGFNNDHPLCERFLNFYINIFTSGAIFAQKGWHDCYGFDAARRNFCMAKPSAREAFVNLAAKLPANTMHPFINCALGSCMDHRKGARKTARSTPDELVVERTEAYWTQWNDKSELPSKKSTLATSIATALQPAG